MNDNRGNRGSDGNGAAPVSQLKVRKLFAGHRLRQQLRERNLRAQRDLTTADSTVHSEILAWHRLATANMGKPSTEDPSVANSTCSYEQGSEGHNPFSDAAVHASVRITAHHTWVHRQGHEAATTLGNAAPVIAPICHNFVSQSTS